MFDLLTHTHSSPSSSYSKTVEGILSINGGQTGAAVENMERQAAKLGKKKEVNKI